MENNNNSNLEHNLVHDMEYTYFTHFSKSEVESVIRKTADVSFLEMLIGTGTIIVLFKKNFLVFTTKTRRAVKRNYYCRLYEVENGTVISGEFKIPPWAKIAFFFCVLFDIWIFSLPVLYSNEFKSPEIMGGYIFIGFLIAIILFLRYITRRSLGKKDKKIILKYIEEVLEAEKVDQR